jgi:multiple sugar transport system substrate-binding protein
MRRLPRTLALALPAVLLAACAGVGSGDDKGGDAAKDTPGSAFSGKPSGSLNIMGFSGEDEVAQARVAAFKEAHPEVQVQQNKGGFDAQQFLTALASGNPPDVVYMDRNLVGTYAAQGAVQPLTECVEEQDIDTGQYREAALRTLTLKDTLYGIPEFYVVIANLIDAESLQEAGLTRDDIQTKDWDKLEAAALKMHQASGAKISKLGYDPKMPEFFPLWAMANGAELIKEDGAPNLNDPKAVEALEFTIRLIEAQGGWTNVKAFRESFDIFGDENPLTKGTIAAYPMENWYVNVLRGSIDKGLKLDSTPFTDREGKTISTVGGNSWVIPKGAKNPGAACAWAKTMTAKDTWMKAAEARMAKVEADKSFFTGLFTANKEADEEIREKHLTDAPDEGFQRAIENYYETLGAAKALNPSAAGSEIDAAWKSAVTRALGGQPAQAALDQAQKEAEAAYQKADRG